MDIINPATEAVIKTVPEDNKEQIRGKYKNARAGQKDWANTPIESRMEIIGKFSALLEANAESLALTLTREMGKPVQQARNEINGARGRINFFLDNAEKWLAPEWMVREGDLNEKISYEPLGVIGNISAWNYPYLVGVNVFIPALIAGNAVLYKPSEYATLTGLEIGRLLHVAGVPEAVFQVICGAKEAGEALLDLPLDGYYFTGSYKTGQYIYEKVAKKMVPCQMELGGKDPMYVTADIANIANAAAAGVEGAMYNNGQSCCAVERIYVHEAVYEPFINAFEAETLKLKMGNPEEEGVFISPLARKSQVAFLQGQVRDALDKGARLLCGGKAPDQGGYFFEPTVLVDTNHEMRVMTEESFGPIIGIQKVQDDAEAIRLMQDTEYGLTAAVYADHAENAEPIMAQMDSGTVYWNCCDRVSPHLPWSGRKHSGIGATLSYLGIRAFVKPKAWHFRGAMG